MRPIEAIVLGVVQGISEFLPISSSAHLILTSRYLGWSDQGLAFDMAANTGSLLAVVTYLRRELRHIAEGLRQWLTSTGAARSRGFTAARPAVLLTLATVPVGVAGLAGHDLIARVAREPTMIGATSIVFGLLLWWADARPRGNRFLSDVSIPMVLIIGLAQALALLPGTSRAGVTLTAALFLGIDRGTAVRFSFLLAVPVGVLVAGKQTVELTLQRPDVESVALGSLALGMTVAGVAAYAAIRWLVRWVGGQDLTGFVAYRLMLGVLILSGLSW